MKIFIKDLTFDAIIGILDFERVKAQSITYNIEINYTGDFVDYAEVRALVIEKTLSEQYFLLEDAINDLALTIKKEYIQIQEMKISLHKNHIFDDCIVGVEEEYKFQN
jgi:7,8-dihydroneopterin aldolase/epimerase/oxygenase